MLHGSSATWFQTACYCRAELNLSIILMYFGLICSFYAFLYLEFGTTELNSTFETTAVPLPGQIDLSLAQQ